jgi:segregation and condensation protein A
VCEDRIHALFLFLNMLELVQQQYIGILIGEGRNNFIVEWNDNRQEEVVGIFPGDEEPYVDQFK